MRRIKWKRWMMLGMGCKEEQMSGKKIISVLCMLCWFVLGMSICPLEAWAQEDFQPGDIINFGHSIINVTLVGNDAEEALQGKPAGFYQYEGIWYKLYQDGGRIYPTIPVRWIVLEDEGDTLLVMQEYVFTGTAWDSTIDGADLKWDNSQIRNYINSEAYLETFFTKEEINDIQVSTVSNTAPGTDGEVIIADTQDRLFLPSIEEIEYYFNTDADRMAHYYSDSVPNITTPMSGWGEAGAYNRTDLCCAYWTRSPAELNYGFSKPGMVDCNGRVGTYGRVYNTWSLGIRPMMRIAKNSDNYYRAPQNVKLVYSDDFLAAYAAERISVKVGLSGDNLTEQYQPYIMYTRTSGGTGRISDSGTFSSNSGVTMVEATLHGLAPTPLKAHIEVRIKPVQEVISVDAYDNRTAVQDVNDGLRITSSGRAQGDGTEIQRRMLPNGEWETIYATSSVGSDYNISYDKMGLYSLYTYNDTTVIEDQEYEYRVRGLYYIKSGSYSPTLEGMEAEWSEPVRGILSYPKGLTIDNCPEQMNVGDSCQLTYVAYPWNALEKKIIWSSSDDGIISITEDGMITAKGAGNGTIYWSIEDRYREYAEGAIQIKVVDSSITPTPPLVPDQQVIEQIRSFVSRMYTVALNRDAEETGLNDWTNRLLTHEIDGAGIAHGFIMSDEFQNRNLSDGDFVDVLYRTFFDREADEGGRNNWLSELAAGRTRGYVLSGFVNSVEFDNLCDSFGIARGTMKEDGSPCNPGIRGFVERCYTKVLDRNGEKAGVEDWTNRIASGQMSAEDVAKSFFFSDEYTGKNTDNETFVETLYQTFMDRSSDAAGKTDWVGRLNSGMGRQEVLEGFSRSEEFAGILAGYGL